MHRSVRHRVALPIGRHSRVTGAAITRCPIEGAWMDMIDCTQRQTEKHNKKWDPEQICADGSVCG